MSKDCFMIAAGKHATMDTSVMVARSYDHDGDFAQQILAVPRKKHASGKMMKFENADVEIPQVPETYAYLAILGFIEGEEVAFNQGGINEFQVCAGASAGGRLNKKAEDICSKMPTSLGDRRQVLVLEQCQTAREGISLVGKLTEKFGARNDSYVIADPNEAWLYEEYRGNLWAAVRVPDDCFIVEANTMRIDHINFKDPDNFMGAQNLVSFAVENDLYDPKSKIPFNPAQIYSTQTGKIKFDIPMPEYDTRRIWRGICLLAPSINLNPDEPSREYPLFVKPDTKLNPKNFLTLFNDHYQGTKYDQYSTKKNQYRSATSRSNMTTYLVRNNEPRFQINEKRQYQLAPEWGTERIIGTSLAVTTWCAQLRSWMPNPIGGLLWAGLSQGTTSGHIPMYSGITKTPKPYTIATNIRDNQGARASEYDERSAYWIFRAVTNLVNLFYTATQNEVIPVWRTWENKLYEVQPVLEKAAVELYEKNPNLAIDLITNYSHSRAIEALELAKDMITKLHTIIARYSGPR